MNGYNGGMIFIWSRKNGGGWQGPVDRRHDKIVTDSFIPTSMILKVQMLNFERGLPAGHDCTGLGHNCCS